MQRQYKMHIGNSWNIKNIVFEDFTRANLHEPPQTQTCSITKKKKTAAATAMSRPSALLFSCGGLKAVNSERDSNRWATVSRQNCCSHNAQLRCGGKLQLRSTSEHPFHFSFVSFSPHPPTLPLSPTCSTRLTFYLTAAALVCVAVDGDEAGFNS